MTDAKPLGIVITSNAMTPTTNEREKHEQDGTKTMEEKGAMRPNAILAAAPLPGVYPGGTDRAALLFEYASALETTWMLRNALSLMTVAGRDYAGADEHTKAVAAHRECLAMAEDVSRHLHRVLDALREAKP